MKTIVTYWIAVSFICIQGVQASDDFIILQSTTSIQNSGLYEKIIPSFETATGVRVKIVAVGTGQALHNAANCNGDVVIVHSPVDEQTFIESGFGIQPHDLMYNQFVIVGPSSDPLGIKNIPSVFGAFHRFLEGQAPFVSRGDDSGTHKKELEIWSSISARPQGSWYLEVGSGMGAALNIAVGIGGYTLTDIGTWLNFRNKQNHDVLLRGGQELFNQYGIILVSPNHCPLVKAELAGQFLEWMISPKGQQLIRDYRIEDINLFYPNAKKRIE